MTIFGAVPAWAVGLLALGAGAEGYDPVDYEPKRINGDLTTGASGRSASPTDRAHTRTVHSRMKKRS
jgi:hypothetical protein